MILYIMRHAEAVEASDTLQDEWRYLTEKGRAAAGKMSSRIAGYAQKTRLIITSPLTRAVQTAEIVAEKASRKTLVIASELLLPGAEISELVEHLKKCKDARRVMLVGHEPQLGSLVALLLGRADKAVSLKKGGCVALELDPEKGEKPAAFLWYTHPGERKITSFKKAFPQRET